MPRVVIATPGPADEGEFLAAMAASRADHRPWLYPPLTPAAYRAYLERLGDRKAGYLARRSEDGALVGWLNVSEIIRGSLQGAFVGYGGVAGLTGQGYMTEALGLVVQRRVHDARPAPPGGEHPARQRGLDRACPALRVRARGLLRALPESGWALARS